MRSNLKSYRNYRKNNISYDGVLLIDKAQGPTSHDIVELVRTKFSIQKVGHGGTLDPLATGLLVILLGKATKLSSMFLASDKEYEGIMKLGVSTDTHDANGKEIFRGDFSSITREDIEREMSKMTGDILQIPPMVSAVKNKGIPLYKLARKGKEVERNPKLIHVYLFELLSFNPPYVAFRIQCSKGTYVRTLCSDIGNALKCGAHVVSLRRIACGNINVKDAIPSQKLNEISINELKKYILPISEVLKKCTPELAKK